MEIRFIDLQRLIELWAAWYSIGVDGWLASDESTHTCSLDLANPAGAHSGVNAPFPYPSDAQLDALFLRALNEIGLQCSRLGTISFSYSSTGADIARAGKPVVALLENSQEFFSGKPLSLFSELRREYGDFGSHTMALEITVKDGQIIVRRSSLEMNNRRRGLKLELWEPLTAALAAYEDIFEQGAALGHSFTNDLSALDDGDDETPSDGDETTPASASEAEDTPQFPEEAESERSVQDISPQQHSASLPFPCLSQNEANHLMRLSNHIAPTRRAVADGAILLSTHPLHELAALITFARYCEPLGVMQRI